MPTSSHQFKPGDRVIVARRHDDMRLSWLPRMDAFLGTVQTVRDNTAYGEITLVGVVSATSHAGHWHFLPESLDLIVDLDADLATARAKVAALEGQIKERDSCKVGDRVVSIKSSTVMSDDVVYTVTGVCITDICTCTLLVYANDVDGYPFRAETSRSLVRKATTFEIVKDLKRQLAVHLAL